MMVRATNRIEKVLRALPLAQDAGLRAAAYVYRNAVVARLIKGYTTGKSVTGLSANSVTIGEPYAASDGRAIRVGTNVKYNVFWELGFKHAGANGQYHRVEIWGPALHETADAQQRAFLLAARAVLEGAVT